MDNDSRPSPPVLPRVGLIGVGNMGGAMAARLLSCGYPVAVHDINPKCEAQAVRLGAMACATATGLAASSDVLFGPHGAASMLPRGAAVLLCPTIAPADTERLAARLQQQGVDCLDAPLSGGPARARDGSMSLMVACPKAMFKRQRALLEALSSHVFHLSENPGDGARTQLVNNLLASINLAGAAEALALAERLGLHAGRTLEVIEQSSGQSWIGSDRMRRAVAGDYRPRAHTALLNQDVQLALAAARAAGIELALGAPAAALLARACDGGFAALDDASLFEVLRKR